MYLVLPCCQVQKPSNEWEWYICTEVEKRIRRSTYSNLSGTFMSIPRCVVDNSPKYVYLFLLIYATQYSSSETIEI